MDAPSTTCDILIVGGGIAGASLGAALVAQGRQVLLVEAESQCGYHATGRSASFWLESYGGPAVAPLSSASGRVLAEPPARLGGTSFLRRRGAVHIAPDAAALPVLPAPVDTRAMDRRALEALLPGLAPRWQAGLAEPGCSDIDVARLHQAYLSAFRRDGGTVATDCRLLGAVREGDGWLVSLSGGRSVTARVIVNAAGAWADDVANAVGAAPVGIAPLRRTMVQLRLDRTGLRDLPLVTDAAGTFYFRGEGERTIWLSPHDEIASDPCDAAPEELDVATAIDRFEQVVDWKIEAVERKWAGLRSFAPDRVPVFGWDPRLPGFFWCAGQGGFGIQTAPAAADLAAALLLDRPPAGAAEGLDPAPFDPSRLS
ncbi:NAD(P)/FAD-dependent oxidoreductase [Sphingomicrobium nitratireducens]|uniref:NAD(P)/FAD-dependent oxidoreductase n=1 Tax=Sphingomicrobium nitratireducens TaxID=2964666 RepID=UPI0022404BD8|nr:FAD-dependent oxidoreductase [Sphingomicrobium nitratireducens]